MMGLSLLIFGNVFSNFASVMWFGADAHQAIDSAVQSTTGYAIGWFGYWLWHHRLRKGKA